MTYKTKISGLSDVRGTHYTQGSDYLYFVRGGTMAQSGVYRAPLNPATLISEGRDGKFDKGATINLNGHGNVDIQWLSTGVLKALGSNAAIELLSTFTSFDAISPSDLSAVKWANTTQLEDGTSVTGRLYAVRIPITGGGFNYAKVRVYKTATGTRIDWTTYLLSADPLRVTSSQYGDLRDIVVSEFESVIYVSSVNLYGDAFVGRAERTVTGPYPEYFTQPVEINTAPLSEPQQIAVDDRYVYVVDNTSLWRIDVDGTTQDKIVTGLQGGVGLLLDSSSTGLFAYIADKTGLRVVNISSTQVNSPTAVAAPDASYLLGTETGFLTWANDEHTVIYFTDRLNNLVKVLDLADKGSSAVATLSPPLASTPWSVEVIGPNNFHVACDKEIGTLSLSIVAAQGVLVLGIGLIPFDYINKSATFTFPLGPNDGKANTSSAAGYYFSQYPNLPFGGNLSLMINHDLAWNSGIRYYRLKLRKIDKDNNLISSRDITSAYTDMKWNPSGLPPKFESVSTAPTSGLYPIRNPAELWYNTHLAAVIATTTADNGHNILEVEFLNASKQPVANGLFKRLLLIDNTRYYGRLEYPRIGTPALPPKAQDLNCGCISYNTKNDLVEVDFAAWQPQATGTYLLRFFRGSTLLATLTQTGDVTSTEVASTKKEVSPGKPLQIGHLIGACDVANITIILDVPSRVIDGFGWVSLSYSSSRSFTLLKAPLTHTPWP